MPKRTKNVPQENTASEAEQAEERVEDPPAETRRTRSGRRVLDVKAPVRTSSRRTRRSVAQEEPDTEGQTTDDPERNHESPVVTKSSTSPEPTPLEPLTEVAEANTETADGGGDDLESRPAAAEKVPVTSEAPKKKPRLAPGAKKIPAVPLGKPKSGRVWKDRNKQRFSAMVRDKPLCSSWEKKMEAKRDKDLVKQYSMRLKEEKAKQKEEKRKRREENLRRRAENEQKAEIVQVIRNTAKIKRMKKKQLRKIEKRDTLALLQKSPKQNEKTKTRKDVGKILLKDRQ